MTAPKGNSFWQQRSSHGRKPIFEKPEDLLSAAQEYFKWHDDNPLLETKVFAYQGTIIEHDVPKVRAMTLDGLCLFLDITHQTWLNYKSNQDFFEVTEEIEKTIKTQKFQGAAADLLNANIIARDLGLADKIETKDETIQIIELSDKQVKQLRKELIPKKK